MWDRKKTLFREHKKLAVPIASLANAADWTMVKVVGTVNGYRERISRDGGGTIAFFDLEDLTGRVTCKVRANQIEACAPVLTSGDPVLLSGKVSFPFRESETEDEEEVPREPTLFVNEVVQLFADSVRKIEELCRLDEAIQLATKKHPEGPDGMRSLAEEVGEVASAIRRETPERVAEELLDVAVVAMRWRRQIMDEWNGAHNEFNAAHNE